MTEKIVEIAISPFDFLRKKILKIKKIKIIEEFQILRIEGKLLVILQEGKTCSDLAQPIILKEEYRGKIEFLRIKRDGKELVTFASNLDSSDTVFEEVAEKMLLKAAMDFRVITKKLF